MGKGNILIQLSTAQDVLPVTSAKVKISDSTSKEVVYESEQSGVISVEFGEASSKAKEF